MVWFTFYFEFLNFFSVLVQKPPLVVWLASRDKKKEAIVVLPVMQLWNYYDNGFRLLRLTSLGIWCCFFLLAHAVVWGKSSGKQHGGIPLETVLDNIVEERIDWRDSLAEDRIHHEKLPHDPEAYMTSV